MTLPAQPLQEQQLLSACTQEEHACDCGMPGLPCMSLAYGGGREAHVRARHRAELFRTLIRQPVEFFDTAEVGVLTSRIGADCQAVVRCLSTNLNVALRNGLQCIGAPCFVTTPGCSLPVNPPSHCPPSWLSPGASSSRRCWQSCGHDP
jgi:hypothetical protein